MRRLTPFDLRKPILRSIDSADLRSGDVAQFRGVGLIASWIRYATHGVHSHSGMIRVDCDNNVDLLEVREFIGGRAIPLGAAVANAPGRIDVFRPRRDRWPEYSTARAVDMMRLVTSRRYGYWGVARLALQRIPFLWRFFPIDTRDVIDGRTMQAPFCSHAVAIACRAGGVDPVPRKPDYLVTPADLTWSLLFDYVCTLTP